MQFPQKHNVTWLPKNLDMVKLIPKAKAGGHQAVTNTKAETFITIATWKVQEIVQDCILAFVLLENPRKTWAVALVILVPLGVTISVAQRR